jgi:hypothetical protein
MGEASRHAIKLIANALGIMARTMIDHARVDAGVDTCCARCRRRRSLRQGADSHPGALPLPLMPMLSYFAEARQIAVSRSLSI